MQSQVLGKCFCEYLVEVIEPHYHSGKEGELTCPIHVTTLHHAAYQLGKELASSNRLEHIDGRVVAWGIVEERPHVGK